jgi:hypothetical protein
MTSNADSSQNSEYSESQSIFNDEHEPRQRGVRMIAPVLSAAVRLWLKSQLDQVEELQVKIESGDQQFLSGCIQQVKIAAQKAVYQGLHLSQVSLSGQQIRVNLGQVLRGQPLRLLEPVPVAGRLWLQAADLNASLQAPLLANAVSEFLTTVLRSQPDLLGDMIPNYEQLNFQNFEAMLAPNQLTLGAKLISGNAAPIPIALRTGLQVENERELKLVKPEWLPSFSAKRGFAIAELDGYTFDLGSETSLQELTLEAEGISCQGKITVIPA